MALSYFCSPRSFESRMRLQHAALVSVLLFPSLLQGQQARPWQSTDYYRLTVVSSPALSPDARRVAFVVPTVVEDKDRRHNEIWMAPADGSGGAGGGPAARYPRPPAESSNPPRSAGGSLLSVR